VWQRRLADRRRGIDRQVLGLDGGLQDAAQQQQRLADRGRARAAPQALGLPAGDDIDSDVTQRMHRHPGLGHVLVERDLAVVDPGQVPEPLTELTEAGAEQASATWDDLRSPTDASRHALGRRREDRMQGGDVER
jgi:hypothetical protein